MVNRRHLVSAIRELTVSYKKQLSKGLKCCFLHVTVWPTLSNADLHHESSKSRFEKSGNALWKQQLRGQGWWGGVGCREGCCRGGGES